MKDLGKLGGFNHATELRMQDLMSSLLITTTISFLY